MSVGRGAEQHECGAGLVEYSLLVVGIAVVAMLSMMAMPTAVKRAVCEAKVGSRASPQDQQWIYAAYGHPYDEQLDICRYRVPSFGSGCVWWSYGGQQCSP